MRTAILSFLFVSCLTATAQQYPLPVIPDSLTAPATRADYATLHFWDQYDFHDTTLLRQDYAEQALANFLSLLTVATTEGQSAAVGRWLDGAAADTTCFHYFVDQTEAYLLSPRSPLHDERLYLLVAKHIADSPAATESERSRASFQIRLFAHNQVGSLAEDFAYQLRDGTSRLLSDTATDRLLLLFFFDPDCDHCRDILFRLRHGGLLRQKISEGRLAVLAVYTEDDETVWEQTKADLPEEWLVAIDRSNVKDNATYDLSEMPVLFLLDEHKQVILRNTDLHQVVEHLITSE